MPFLAENRHFYDYGASLLQNIYTQFVFSKQNKQQTNLKNGGWQIDAPTVFRCNGPLSCNIPLILSMYNV